MNKNKFVPTAPAAIMALGIFLIGSIEMFPRIDQYFGSALAGLLIIIWLYMYGTLISQMIDIRFRHSLLNNPIHFFAIGTWIAAVSVLTIVVLKYFPSLQPMIYTSAIINIACWSLFIFLAVSNLWKLTKMRQCNVHGLILLATVATQSTAIMSKAVFPIISPWILIFWIYLGFILYSCGFILLFKSYVLNRNWNLATDWKNTNCIIHGAISISGVAMAVSGIFTPVTVIICWLTAFLLLIFVETIELIRAYIRIKALGLKQALFIFDTSQWARNFTFGMFFVLSKYTFEIVANSVSIRFVHYIEQSLTFLAAIVILLLIIEFILLIHSVLQDFRQNIEKVEASD